MNSYLRRLSRVVSLAALAVMGTSLRPHLAYAGQVVLCHISHPAQCRALTRSQMTRRNYETIRVAPSAVGTHLRHGDFLGNCDPDNDGVRNDQDNCPTLANATQTDTDRDGRGDACDNCPQLANSDQADADGDGVGSACDNCPQRANSNQADADSDGVGTACDNCPQSANSNQADADADGVGTACDNCPQRANSNQADADSDGVGTACDNCPQTANSAQADSDADGAGNVCDNCAATANSNQLDGDGDGNGDMCDRCPGGADNADADADGTPDFCDGCSTDPTKTAPGACGCGIPDADNNGNGIIDCIEPPTPTTTATPSATPSPTPTSTVDVSCTDADGDGFLACEDDCNDHNAAVHPSPPCLPGQVCSVVFEILCDGIDQDCSGGLAGAGCEAIGATCGNHPCKGVPCGTDADGDGFACHEDCNDHDATVHPSPPCLPGQVCSVVFDVPCDGIDRDCSGGVAGAGCEEIATTCPGSHPCKGMPCDADGDGFQCAEDCDDHDSTVHPNPPCPPGQICFIRGDIACDGKDIDCSLGYAAGGCEPLTAGCAEAACGDAECGSVSDLCGGTISCGTCPSPFSTCVANRCCEAELLSCTRFEIVNGQFITVESCGVVSDACGGGLDCSGCPAGQTCNESNLECEPLPPGPTPVPCVPNCDTCGGDDGCGGRCMVCPDGKTCIRRSLPEKLPGFPLSVFQCLPFCSNVECGRCIVANGEITISNIESCPTGRTCQNGVCVPPAEACPGGCFENEQCNSSTHQCECVENTTTRFVCDRATEYCSDSGRCCPLDSLLNFLCL